MRITVISALMLSVLTGCVKSAENSELLVADHESPTIENCFSSLVAGPKASNGKLEVVAFAHGICQGSSKALDKLSEQTSVTIAKGAQSWIAPLYIQGQDVVANLDGLNVKIGSTNKNSDDAELILNTGAKVELAIEKSDGSVEIWQPGSTAKGKEIIRVSIN